MAKRLEREVPYTPLDDSLVNSVLKPPQEQSPQDAPIPQTSRRASSPRTRPRTGTQVIGQPVLDAPSNQDAAKQSANPAETERMNATLRVKASSREKREFESFVARLGAALDTTLKPSNLLRALLTVAQHAEAEFTEKARRLAPLRRPPNDDAIAYAEFEHRLVRLIDAAIRAATPMR